MDTRIIENQSFGWNRNTHHKMTMLALRDINIDSNTKNQIARYSQMPDFIKSELGWHNNTHFFFPYAKNQSFGIGKNKHNNAFSKFEEHVQNSLNSRTKEEFYKYAGFAMHYLQDVSMPMHTEPGGFIKKIFDFYLHKNFERGKIMGAATKTSELAANYKPLNLKIDSLNELFLSTTAYSQRPYFKVSRFNKYKWPEIQQHCFNRGVDASRCFFEKIIKLATTLSL